MSSTHRLDMTSLQAYAPVESNPVRRRFTCTSTSSRFRRSARSIRAPSPLIHRVSPHALRQHSASWWPPRCCCPRRGPAEGGREGTHTAGERDPRSRHGPPGPRPRPADRVPDGQSRARARRRSARAWRVRGPGARAAGRGQRRRPADVRGRRAGEHRGPHHRLPRRPLWPRADRRPDRADPRGATLPVRRRARRGAPARRCRRARSVSARARARTSAPGGWRRSGPSRPRGRRTAR
jgi:hypothetical protein